jgi:hypothetical protein
LVLVELEQVLPNPQVTLEVHRILDLFLHLEVVLLQTHILEQITQIIVETQEVLMVVEEQDLEVILAELLVVQVLATLLEEVLKPEDMVDVVEMMVLPLEVAMELLVQHQKILPQQQTLVLEVVDHHLVDPQETAVPVLLSLPIQMLK